MKQTQDLTQTRLGDAFFTDVTTICGVKLKPFCLGHIILLEALNNPIIGQEVKDIPLEDAISHFFIALLICALSYEEALILLTDEKVFSEEITSFCDNLIKNMELEPSWNIVAKQTLFREYMSRHLDMPLYNETTTADGSAPSGNDWKTSIFVVFKKLGFSESETLNMNIKKLFLTWAAYAESEGAVKIMNKYEVDTIKKFNSQKGGV